MLLGLCAILQGTFLHGFLLLHFLGIPRAGILSTWILSFALSVTANYLLVTLLVAIGVYLPVVMYCIFAAELVLVLRIVYPYLVRPARELGPLLFGPYLPFWSRFRTMSYSDKAFALTGLVLALLCIFTVGRALAREMGTIFSVWDDVVSWNHWATMWAANDFPHGTLSYPQLLPALWSLTYVFMQDNTIQFFAKGLMPLYPLAILLVYLDLGLRQKRADHLYSVLFAVVILQLFMKAYVYEGFADTPVGFMCLASIYALLLAADEADPERRTKYILAGTLIVVGCAHTKQVGMYMAALYLPLAFLLTTEEMPASKLRESLSDWLKLAALVVLLVAPWYLVAHWQMWMGVNRSNIYDLVVTEHASRSLIERWEHAWSLLSARLDYPGASIMVVMIAIVTAMLDRQWRWLVGLVIVPFYIIWAMLFSYDQRTLAFIMPLAGGMMGIAASRAWNAAGRPFVSGRMPTGVYLGTAVLLVLIASLAPQSSMDRLRARQIERQRLIGEPLVNEQAYRQFGIQPGSFVTNYTMLQAGFLPGLERQAISDDFKNLSLLRKKLSQSAATYILVRTDIVDNRDVRRFLDEKTDSGDFELLYRKDSGRQFLFLKVLRP